MKRRLPVFQTLARSKPNMKEMMTCEIDFTIGVECLDWPSSIRSNFAVCRLEERFIWEGKEKKLELGAPIAPLLSLATNSGYYSRMERKNFAEDAENWSWAIFDLGFVFPIFLWSSVRSLRTRETMGYATPIVRLKTDDQRLETNRHWTPICFLKCRIF